MSAFWLSTEILKNGYPMNDTGTIRTGKKSFDSVIPVLVQQSLTETSVLHTM